MNKSEQIQQEINNIIGTAKAMHNYSKMNKVTKKARQELRDLGLEQYVPAWIMQDGAKSDRIVEEIIKAAKEDGTRKNYNNRTDSEGENTTAIGAVYPQSKLNSLMNIEEEEVTETAISFVETPGYIVAEPKIETVILDATQNDDGDWRVSDGYECVDVATKDEALALLTEWYADAINA
jgi:hypothetical protein